jgi:hypothetical protein
LYVVEEPFPEEEGMPKVSPLAVIEPARLRQIALRIRNRMGDLGLTEEALARRCTNLAQNRFPEPFFMTRERIAKILMNCHKEPKPSAAKVLMPQELEVLAIALKVPQEWLLGQAESRDMILWDPLAHPGRREELLHLMNFFEERSGEALVWAEGLLCSLTTPELHRAYHQALFAELDELGLQREKQQLVTFYEAVGEARRERRRQRPSRLTQLLFLSDLKKLAHGDGAYRIVGEEICRRAIGELQRLLEERQEITLTVIGEQRERELRWMLQGIESVGVCGDQVVIIRMRNGCVLWSENREWVGHYSRVLERLREQAVCREPQVVLELLGKLGASVR